MFIVSALPASFGDCIWIEYGPDAAPHVILIDAGPTVPAALEKRLQQLAARGGQLELVVVTHIDADHIGGMLTLLEKNFYGVPVRDFWFNGFRHLPGETFGERQGERLTGLLLDKNIPWNAEVGNAAFMVANGKYPVVDLPGGAIITLLSPGVDQLKVLKKKWITVCGEADLYADMPAKPNFYSKGGQEHFGGVSNVAVLADRKFEEDKTEANGSSIAFTIEFDGKRILCGADSFPSRLLLSLKQVDGEKPYVFDLVKLPHHGSENNVSTEFVKALNCPQYLFSSNGARYKHPSQAAVARVILHGGQPKLLFNYRSAYNEMWDSMLLRQVHGYSIAYGDEDGITVDLSS